MSPLSQNKDTDETESTEIKVTVGDALAAPETADDARDTPEAADNTKTLIQIILLLSVSLLAAVAALIALGLRQSNQTHSTNEMTSLSNQNGDMHVHFWTKKGLEMIPLSQWSYFSPDDFELRPYVTNMPFPGDEFTDEHLRTWNSVVGAESIEGLIERGFIVTSTVSSMVGMEEKEVSAVPAAFADPIIIEETPIDYRIQYAVDIGSRSMIGERAIQGRLVNPAGRRLREHFYRFPDQCDATPIALEVFLRLMIYHQIEMFFTENSIGLWHDLFPEVERRPHNSFEINLARWYGERYAESYVHKITNNWVYPLPRQNIDAYMMAVGLDPEDKNEDPTSSVGLGNLVGRRVTEWMNMNDGLARETDFVDEVGLQRIEDYHSTKEWHQWKPSLAGSDRFQGIRYGIVTQQTFVSPSLGIFSFLYSNEEDFLTLGLQAAVPVLDTSEEAYLKRAEEFLDIQRNLSDRQKAVAELSNNKISGSLFLIWAFVPILKELTTNEEYPALYDEFSMVTSGCAEYAATHAAWRHKRTYLAGRPQTILPELAAQNSEFREAYPEAETFKPLIPAGDHPEYPSGSSAIYTAFAQAADDWFEKRLNFTDASKKTGPLEFVVPAKKFYWSDGPEEDVKLEYNNLDEWIQELPLSRVYGGVHWLESGEAGLALGKAVGHACTRLLDRLTDGDMEATYTAPMREPILPFNPSSNDE